MSKKSWLNGVTKFSQPVQSWKTSSSGRPFGGNMTRSSRNFLIFMQILTIFQHFQSIFREWPQKNDFAGLKLSRTLTKFAKSGNLIPLKYTSCWEGRGVEFTTTRKKNALTVDNLTAPSCTWRRLTGPDVDAVESPPLSESWEPPSLLLRSISATALLLEKKNEWRSK